MNPVSTGHCGPCASQGVAGSRRRKRADGQALCISSIFEFALLPIRAALCHFCFSRLRKSTSVIEE